MSNQPQSRFFAPRDPVAALFEAYKTLDVNAIKGAVCARDVPLELPTDDVRIISFNIVSVAQHSPITASVTYRATASDGPNPYTETITVVKGAEGWKVCQLTRALEALATDEPSHGPYITSPANRVHPSR
jgi:hypothetical protein